MWLRPLLCLAVSVQTSCCRDVEVKRIESYGVFVDVGEGRSNGLVHVSQLELGRVEDPAQLFSAGDRIDVQVRIQQLAARLCAPLCQEACRALP